MRAVAEEAFLIVHIIEKMDWEQAKQAGEYRAASLATEGFIHTSRPEQVLGVANRFYQGATDLLLLWIDPKRLSAPVRFEASDGELFPHIYGPVNLDSVLRVCKLAPDTDGVYRILN
jgi:uncharacterized protein (DUF952 family)